jgi:tetraacyldisaccharide 4'-kinase
MNPLSSLFGAGVALRNRLYDRGSLAVHRLAWPVVSVGNLRVGGSGKTPFVLMLGELLQERQIAFDILSRGYGRQDHRIRLVEEGGSPREFGDEPLLMAQRLGVPVIVGADRFAAGQYAETLFAEVKPAHGGRWLHLLDDGFQHRRLHRDLDIVLVTPEDAGDALLPVGRMREPLDSLRRADVIVLTEGATLDPLPSFAKEKHVWRVLRKLEVDGGLPSRPFAFCGIARPERFTADLRRSGITLSGERFFPDHHFYTDADVQLLNALRRDAGGGGFVTTEKDAVRLRASGLWEQLAPIQSLALRMELLDAPRALDTLLGTLAERARC